MSDPAAGPAPAADPEPVYVTHPLAEALCALAADAEPDSVSVPLATSPPSALLAADASGAPLADVPTDAAVFSEFYFPDAGGAVSAVFGVDLATPSGRTRGRFVSHPTGGRSPTMRDDLAARVLVAVPPWDAGDVRAYDRRGRRSLVLVAADAPEEAV